MTARFYSGIGLGMSRLYLSADMRRSEAIAAVIGLAARCDPAEITTGQIAATMGVSQGALFRHFPDKQSIWTAVLDWTCTELQRRFEGIVPLPPLDRLEAMLAAHIGFIMENTGVPRILWGELQRAGETPAKAIVRQLMATYRARVAGELSAAHAAGQIAVDADLEAATVMFLALVQGLVMQALAVDDFSVLPAMSKRQFALFCRSLEAVT